MEPSRQGVAGKPALLRTDESPPELTPGAQTLFFQIFSGEFLGASRNIRMINEMFCTIAEEWPATRPGLVENLEAVGDFVRRTRGKNTPAIDNAIGAILHGLDTYRAAPPDVVHAEILARRAAADEQSLRNLATIADYGANLLDGASTVMAFDYSSSVQAILNRLAARGRTLRVVVPESRALDGGRAFVSESTAAGHLVDYVPDMAFAHFLPACHAVLLGVETVFANGDAWNTIGSYAVAVLAERHHVPCYIPTELIKIAPDSYRGTVRQIVTDDFAALLGKDRFAHAQRVRTEAPEVERIPAALITGYITPEGLLLPHHLRDAALRFLHSTGVDPFDAQAHSAFTASTASTPSNAAGATGTP